MMWMTAFALIFAGLAIINLVNSLNELLAQMLTMRSRNYTFEPLEERVYKIYPCPPKYELIRSLSNVVWADKEGDVLVVKAESWDSVQDIVKTLNSGV